MLKLISKLIRDERAQDLAEYGIALAVIGAGAALAAVAIAGDVNTLWSVADSVISNAASSVVSWSRPHATAKASQYHTPGRELCRSMFS